MPPQQQRRVSNCSILVPSLPEKQHQAFSLSLFVSLYPSLSFFEQIHNITCTTQHVGTRGGARPAWFPCLPLPFRPSSPPSSLHSLSFKQNATSIRALGYCTHPFPRMGESGPAACSPLALTHSFGHTSMFQNSGIQLRLLSLNSPFGHLHRKTDRQTDLTSYVIEDEVHFIRATTTPSLCPSPPTPLPFWDEQLAAGPLFHESYTLYRHLPSLSLSLPGYVRCQIGTPTIALLAKTDREMPNGKLNADAPSSLTTMPLLLFRTSSFLCEVLILFSYDDDDLRHGGETRTQWEASGA